MAIRIRKDCVKQYQVYWTNPFTKKRESVFCESLLEAQKTDAQVKYRLTWEKESFRPVKSEKEEVSDTTLGGVIYAYFQERQLPQASVRTIMIRLRAAVEMFGKKAIGDITDSDIGKLMLRISSTGIKPVQVRIRMRTIKTVFIWAKKRHLIQSIPDWPEMPIGTFEHFVPPTQEELARILEVATPHLKRAVIIATRCGCRVGSSELLKLRWQDVDWDRNVLRVHAAKKNLAEPIREVPVRSDVMPLLKKWFDDDSVSGIEYICHYEGRQLKSLATSWATALRRAGITRRIRPYDLRHAFATELIAAGADLGTVAKLMGHTNVQTVLRSYQHVMTSQKVAAIEALPDLPMCHDQCATSEVRILQ